MFLHLKHFRLQAFLKSFQGAKPLIWTYTRFIQIFVKVSMKNQTNKNYELKANEGKKQIHFDPYFLIIPLFYGCTEACHTSSIPGHYFMDIK